MKKISLLFFAVLLLLQSSLFAQGEFRTCGSMEVLDRQLRADPAMQFRIDQIEQLTNSYIAKQKHAASERTAGALTVTIPVVVHVVYRTSAENISDAQVLSQIDVLNKDYAKINSDTGSVPDLFKALAANTGVQFCLAQRDPNGNPTTGIVRKLTTKASFSSDDGVKKSSAGGDDAWDRNKYLNIWVCSLGGGLLGYAQFPGGTAATDGVVILNTAFGNTGTAASPYNLGRTATHEVGHWLNLRHIWGDASCGNDLVSDTPTQQAANYGCPTFPHKTCSNTGDMSMNYMDYTDDRCMYMFSAGQSTRMNALFATGGARASLLTSNGCTPVDPNACYAPSNLQASLITQTTATLSWSSFGTPVSYNIQYKLTSASTWTTVTSLTTSVGLTGLTSNSAYQFQVQAVCANGTSPYSAASTFTTAAEPGSCVANLFEPNNTMTQLAPIATGTDIKAMIETGGDIDWFSFTNSVSQPNIQLNLTNLPKNYSLGLYKAGVQLASSANAGTADEAITYTTTTVGTYWIRVAGNSTNYSNTLCYTLKATIYGTQMACGIPSGLSATNIDQVSATLTWGAVTNATSYTIQYRIQGTTPWTTVTSATNSKSISGLTASSKYEFQVKATCTSGSSDFSTSGNFTTAGQTTSCTANIYEPNNTMAQIKPIALNTEIGAMIETGSDVDWFSFANSALSSNIQVKLYNLPKDYSLKLFKSGVELASSANTGTADEVISYNTKTVGTYWIRVFGNSANYSNTQCYTVKATTSGTNFFSENTNASEAREMKKETRIYPNPSRGDVMIEYTSSGVKPVVVKVADLSGNELYYNNFDAAEGSNQFDLKLNDIANGLYLIEINDGTERTIHKIMIQK